MNLKNVLFGALLCATAASGLNAQQIDTTRVVNGMERPVVIAHAPGDADRLFVCEKRGRIRIVDLTTNQLLPTPFLDVDSITCGGTSLGDERGLLGLAFHPEYADNGYFFIFHTDNGCDTRVVRYKVSANPNLADPASAKVIITVDQPYSNHNGGAIEFDNDGFLLIAHGDGGSFNDPGARAQDITNQLLGKILRIDIDTPDGVPYAIPSDNPFVGTTGDDEILHYGLRNPWKIYVDPFTDDLYIGDVGQNAVEEIDVVAMSERGLNFGWRCKEGNNCTGLSGCSCSSSALTPPVYAYNQGSAGYSVTGGVVYYGCAIPDLQGTYFFADYGSGNIWSFRLGGSTGYNSFANRNELETSLEGFGVDNIPSFGTDANGEVYILDQNGGELFKIVNADGNESCFSYPVGDINQDCVVDGMDLAQVLATWNFVGDSDTDLDGDGVVGGQDLAFVLANWQQTCD